MEWQARGINSIGGVPNVGKLDRRSRKLLLISQANLNRVGSACESGRRIIDIQALASNSEEIAAGAASNARQENSNSRILRIRRIVVLQQTRFVTTRSDIHPSHNRVRISRIDQRCRKNRIDTCLLVGTVVTSRQQVSVRIQDLDHSIQGIPSAIDVEPNFGSSRCNKAINVLVVRFAQNAVNDVTQG